MCRRSLATIVAVVGTLVVVMSGRAAPAGARRPPARREGVGLWSEAGFCCHKNLYNGKHRKTKESPRGPESPVSLITPWNRLPSSRQFVEQSTNPSTSEASLASARQVRAPLRAATMLKPPGTSHPWHLPWEKTFACRKLWHAKIRYCECE